MFKAIVPVKDEFIKIYWCWLHFTPQQKHVDISCKNELYMSATRWNDKNTIMKMTFIIVYIAELCS